MGHQGQGEERKRPGKLKLWMRVQQALWERAGLGWAVEARSSILTRSQNPQQDPSGQLPTAFIMPSGLKSHQRTGGGYWAQEKNRLWLKICPGVVPHLPAVPRNPLCLTAPHQRVSSVSRLPVGSRAPRYPPPSCLPGTSAEALGLLFLYTPSLPQSTAQHGRARQGQGRSGWGPQQWQEVTCGSEPPGPGAEGKAAG